MLTIKVTSFLALALAWKRLDGGIVDRGIVKGTFAIFYFFCTSTSNRAGLSEERRIRTWRVSWGESPPGEVQYLTVGPLTEDATCPRPGTLCFSRFP